MSRCCQIACRLFKNLRHRVVTGPNVTTKLDLTDKLAEYAQMNVRNVSSLSEDQSLSSPCRVRYAAWAVSILAAAIIAGLAFGAYRQPELLLNLMGLRYCG